MAAGFGASVAFDSPKYCFVFLYSSTVGGVRGGLPLTAGWLCWGGTPLLSTQSVIIIIATDPMAQFTIGDPVQKLVDMLPLTSSAILIRFPVGVTF